MIQNRGTGDYNYEENSIGDDEDTYEDEDLGTLGEFAESYAAASTSMSIYQRLKQGGDSIPAIPTKHNYTSQSFDVALDWIKGQEKLASSFTESKYAANL